MTQQPTNEPSARTIAAIAATLVLETVDTYLRRLQNMTCSHELFAGEIRAALALRESLRDTCKKAGLSEEELEDIFDA